MKITKLQFTAYKFKKAIANTWQSRLPLSDEELAHLKNAGKAEKLLPHNPPAWAASEAIWDKAKKHVKQYWDEYDDPWAVVADVYFQMGGKKKK